MRDGQEGGCGVIGLACTEKVAGRHLLTALTQMCNRGNGKGGGIAAVGLSPSTLGISQQTLDEDYLLAIAYLDMNAREQVEKEFIRPLFDIDHIYTVPHLSDYRQLNDLDIKPPEAILYFVRIKPDKRQEDSTEDEIVYKNSFRLNQTFYCASGEKRAFVLSHGKNLLVLKLVGLGNDVIRYYQLENFTAHVWIGHHRYPTKGRVWHPGGAHPFIGMNEALVHNGDFANYFSLCEYLAQRGIYPQFLTDTEVAALIFDLLIRTYGYPLEYVIEVLAPTTERDFTLLPEDKQRIYSLLQKTHMHNSPDGPWFFLIVQSLQKIYRLIGITDTSMLRPQVFALQKGPVPIGFSASEKQAIDAVLRSLSEEDSRFWTYADHYWNARGGSYTDGGAFAFSVYPQKEGPALLQCTDKFGNEVHAKAEKPACTGGGEGSSPVDIPVMAAMDLYAWAKREIPHWTYEQFDGFLAALQGHADADLAFEVMTLLLDHRYPTGNLRRSCLLDKLSKGLASLSARLPSAIVLRADKYPSEGPNSLAREIVDQAQQGVKKLIIINCRGHRFIGNGMGPNTEGLHIDVYGSSGDYLASGIDGAEITVHGTAQDQLGQIMKSGKLVVYGDVGQTFFYGAKGGEAYILGNAAGRPLINAVGKPRVVINGTCLDYLAESFMAGNPLYSGGFVIVNGIAFDEEGAIIELPTPYPGNNLFSLASGGAIYIRDPEHKLEKDQLNAGEYVEVTPKDWEVMLPFLRENERLFEIPIDRLLSYRGHSLPYHKIYRKIAPSRVRVLQEEEAWVKAKTN